MCILCVSVFLCLGYFTLYLSSVEGFCQHWYVNISLPLPPCSSRLSWSPEIPLWRWGATGRWRRRWTSPDWWRWDTWRWPTLSTCKWKHNLHFVIRHWALFWEEYSRWQTPVSSSECCGALEYYDKAFDRITTRNEKQLKSIKRIFHTVTTTDDPVIRKVSSFFFFFCCIKSYSCHFSVTFTITIFFPV